jgi:tetratricopeptide (TPR) repeat protein
MARMLAWLGIASATVYLVLAGGGWWGIYLPQLRIVTVGTIVIAIGIWAWLARRDPAWRPRSVMIPALVACLASLAISTVFSRVPRVSFEYLSYSVLLAASYLLLVRILSNGFLRPRVLTLASLLFVVLAGFFLARIVGSWIEWWTTLGRLATPPLRPESEGLTYGNPSAVLTIVTLFAAAAAAQWGSATRRGVAVIVGVGVVIALVALVSGSRAGWFALAAAALVTAALWLSVGSHRTLARDTATSLVGAPFGRPVAVVAVVAIVGAAVLFGPAILQRASAGGEDLRASYVAIALRLFAQSPIVGTGPGSWVIQRIHETLPTETDSYIPHAHDVPAQTLAELGLVGSLAGIVLVVSLVRLYVGAARSDDPIRRRWAWLGGGALIYFGFHNLLDFYPNMPAILFAAAVPTAFLDAEAVSQRETGHLMAHRATTAGMHSAPGAAGPLAPVARAWRPLTALVLAAIAASFALWQELPALQADAAVAAANRGDWAAAIGPATSAARSDPTIGSYQMTLGLMADRTGDRATATEAFRLVATRDDLPEAWLDLAAEQVAAGDKVGAIASIEAALRLGYQRVAILVPAGDLALRLGDVDLAASSFESAIEATPSLAGDPWWTAAPGRSGLFPIVLADAISNSAPGDRWEIALMAGDIPQATERTADASIGENLALAVVAAWSAVPGSIDRVTDACQAQPLNITLLGWCARLEARADNQKRASDFRSLIDSETGGPSAGTVLRVGADPVIGQALAGDPATYWGFFTYRRATPYDLLLGSLPHLVFE